MHLSRETSSVVIAQGAENAPVVRVRVVGPFRLEDAQGLDITPRGRKACAILAMLALSREATRPRRWLQDRLWSDRGEEQGSASLRQCLAEIRKALGPARDILKADGYLVALDQARFSLDRTPRRGADLLEGLDIRDSEFNHWLAAERAACAAEQGATAPGPVRAPLAATPGASGARLLVLEPPSATAPGSLPLGSPADGKASIPPPANALLEAIARSLDDLGLVRVIDRRLRNEAGEAVTMPGAPGQVLDLRAEVAGPGDPVRLLLTDRFDQGLVWSGLPGRQVLGDPAGADWLSCVNEVTGAALRAFEQAGQAAPDDPARLCLDGMRRLFRLEQSGFAEADRLFALAHAQAPRGLYLAWRAYLRTFVLAERVPVCRKTLDEEGLAFMHQALELEPHNSYVLALSAHVQAMLRRSYVTAHELAERSVRLNGANPIGWACYGMAKCHLGRADEGLGHVLRAREIAGSAIFRYQLDALGCIAASIAGDHDTAIRCGEASHAQAPRFAPPLRYLSALYMHQGANERAFEMVEALRAVEPDFSFSSLRDKAYPAIGLHRSGLLASLPAGGT